MERFIFIVLLSFLFLSGCEKEEINVRDTYLGNWKFTKTYQSFDADEKSKIESTYYGQISPGNRTYELLINYGIGENIVCSLYPKGNKKMNTNFSGLFKSDIECEFEIINKKENLVEKVLVSGFKQ